MKSRTIRTRRGLLAAAVLAMAGLVLSSSAGAVAVFEAEAEARLGLTANSNLTINIVDTFFDKFEVSLGDSQTAAAGNAVPMVDAFAGDPPVELVVDQALFMSVSVEGAATSTAAEPFSLATASVLGTAILRIENQSTSPGGFSFDLDWELETFLAMDHGGEMAGVDLELFVAAYDDFGLEQFGPIVLFSTSLDTELGDLGRDSSTGGQAFDLVVGAGESWDMVIDLFAINGRASSTLPAATVPAPASLLLLGLGLIALGIRRKVSAA